MIRSTRVIGFLAAAALCGCAASTPKPAGPVPAPQAGAQLPASDTCGARDYAWLIGENRERVPPTPEGKAVRVVCSTCPMTMDFNAARLNIIHHQDTGVVEKLTCG